MGKFATYKRHYRDNAEGHIYLDKEGACTVHLDGAASMSQDELDLYGKAMAKALNKEIEVDSRQRHTPKDI